MLELLVEEMLFCLHLINIIQKRVHTAAGSARLNEGEIGEINFSSRYTLILAQQQQILTHSLKPPKAHPPRLPLSDDSKRTRQILDDDLVERGLPPNFSAKNRN